MVITKNNFFFSWMHLDWSPQYFQFLYCPPLGFFSRHGTQADNPKETNASPRSLHAAAEKTSPLGLFLVFALNNSNHSYTKLPQLFNSLP